MNRKPIFDAVRILLGGRLTKKHVQALDLACDLAEAAVPLPAPEPAKPKSAPSAASAHRLGALSQKYESAKEGPGAVSTGVSDPGGVSYGTYQLSSAAGTLTAFLKAEGKPWADRFGASTPGSADFSRIWKEIAAAQTQAFGDAQHTFIERTHYRTAVAAVLAAKGLDLDARHDGVRDACWSVAVQHSKAAVILIDAVNACDKGEARTSAKYDRRLIEAIYARRTDYVLGVAANTKLPKGQRNQLISITKNRYPAELADALKMLDAAGPVIIKSVQPGAAAATIDGNAVAAANGVLVRSAAVKISQLDPAMGIAITAVAKLAKTMDLPTPVITSGNDSTHKKGSLHYDGRALDSRGNNVLVSVGRKFAESVQAEIGSGYDVIFEIFENASNNHLHVEFDPA